MFDKGVFESDGDDNDSDFGALDEDSGEHSALSIISSLFTLFKCLFSGAPDVLARISVTPGFMEFLEKYTRKQAIDAIDDVIPIWEMSMKSLPGPIPKSFWQ